MNKKLAAFIASFSLLVAMPVMAEKAYIVDQLLVGLHKDKNMDSPIIKVLATGAEVDIINREGDFVEIRELSEDKIGWVDASYLMRDKPAIIQLKKLQEKVKELESEEGAQAALKIREKHEAEVAILEQKIEELTQNLSSEKLKSGELEATLSTSGKKLAHLEANASDERLTELEKLNTELENKLAVTQQGELSYTGKPTMLEILEPFKNNAVLVALGLLALIAFLFGRHWEDKSNRKRHGGFKV